MAPLGDQVPQTLKVESGITLVHGPVDAAGRGVVADGDLGVLGGSPSSSTALSTLSGCCRQVLVDTTNNGITHQHHHLQQHHVQNSIGWHLVPSLKAKRTSNPVRNIVDNLRPPKDDGSKPTISLALGDPTTFGNLPCPDVLLDAITQNVASRRFNGYLPSVGSVEARRALASAHSLDNLTLTEEDVVICSGGSGALEIALSALLDEGDNLLIPRPGFALYQVITHSLGGYVREYELLPERSWEIDVAHLESLIDERTKAILINNPSNPCGNVLPRDNLLDLLAVAEKHRLPVISDEIYAKMTFAGHTFHPIASLTTTVPVLTIGGMAKQFGVPGWRVGWILIYDRHSILSSGEVSIRQGIKNLTQIIVGANTLIQSAIPSLFPPAGSSLATSLDSFYTHYVTTLETNAAYVISRVRSIPGLEAVVPQGAMYVMIRLLPGAFGEDYDDDVAFSQALLAEENLVVLPGQCFGIRGFVRVVFAPPVDKLAEAMDRLEAFCRRHHQHSNSTAPR